MTPSVHITGVGLLTPLGETRERSWRAICAGESVEDVGIVPNVPQKGGPRVNVLACQAASEAISNAGWENEALGSAALVVGTSKGPVDAWLNALSEAAVDQCTSPSQTSKSFKKELENSKPSIFGLADTSHAVARDLNIYGPRLLLSGACASGLLALIRGVMMIQSGTVGRVLVVAAESSMHPLFTASFRRLGVIAPQGHGCRPFDEGRAGFFVSEAAAAVCLESSDLPTRRSPVWPVIDRFGTGADACHLTSGDPEATTLRRILSRTIDARAIDLVHAHGTATLTNDPVELSALDACLTDQRTELASLYSSKGAIGHSLGAAGLVAIALNCLAHRDQLVPPSPRTAHPIPCRTLVLRRQQQHRSIQRSLAVAAGFGGAIAAVSLSSCEFSPDFSNEKRSE